LTHRVSSLDSMEIVEGMLPENRFDERSLRHHAQLLVGEREENYGIAQGRRRTT
jgi:hypothetical protein